MPTMPTMPIAADGWQTHIHGYCERTSDAFWAEPVNALTNGAFLVAAVAVLVWARRTGRFDLGIGLLIALTAAIGVGSFLFHTLATRWAAIADVVPILAFIVAYLMIVCRRFFGLAWTYAVPIGLAYLPASIGFRLLWRRIAGGGFGATGGYLPAVVALLVVAGLLARRRHPAARPLAVAAVLFVVSLSFRSLDLPLCAAMPLGTHFLWHLLNGALLAWLMLTMLRHGTPSPYADLRRPPERSRRGRVAAYEAEEGAHAPPVRDDVRR